MPLRSKSGEMEVSAGLLPATLVTGESISNILDAGKACTRTELPPRVPRDLHGPASRPGAGGGDRDPGPTVEQNAAAPVPEQGGELARRRQPALVSEAAASEGAVRGRFAPHGLTRPARARRQILLIEDDVAIAATLGEALEDEGYVVHSVGDGREGVARALSTRPDLILLDVNLPSLDGFAAAVQLRQASTTRDIPIIFLSARRDLSAQVRVLRLEHLDFLRKPFSGSELLTRIEQAFIGAHARQKLAHQAAVDELTGLGNLWSFRARLAEEHQRFSRYGSPLALAMIDVDKLKAINDQHGHVAGSDALRAMGDVLRRESRTTDLAARYGGDEMVVLLAHTALAEASVFAERVRSEIARLVVHGFRLTVSIGVAALSGPGSLETDDQLLRRADSAAYSAKRLGGDRIYIEGEGPA